MFLVGLILFNRGNFLPVAPVLRKLDRLLANFGALKAPMLMAFAGQAFLLLAIVWLGGLKGQKCWGTAEKVKLTENMSKVQWSSRGHSPH